MVLAAAHRAANSSKMNFFFSMDKNFSAYPSFFLLLYAEQAGQPRAAKPWMIESKEVRIEANGSRVEVLTGMTFAILTYHLPTQAKSYTSLPLVFAH